MACLFCNSETKTYFPYGKYVKGSYGLVRCESCGLVQTDPMPTEDFLCEWYQQYDVLGEHEPYYQGLASDDPWKTPEGFEIAMQFALVKKWAVTYQMSHVKCLDVGAGQGHFLDLVKRANWQGVGIELNAQAAAKAEERFGVDVRVGTFDSIGLARESFDIITLWDIFEHVSEPIHMVERAHALLKSGGFLFIETPNVQSMLDAVVIALARMGIRGPAKTFYGLHHLTLWHVGILKDALVDIGFTIQEVRFASTPPRRIFRSKGIFQCLKRMVVSWVQAVGMLTHRQNKMIIIARKLRV